MRKNGLCVVFLSIALLTSNACPADTNLTESCEPNQELGSAQISENAQGIVGEEDSTGDVQQKKELLPLGDIVSSTLQIPSDAVKFVAEIPYDDIIWSTLEATAEVIEFIVDDGFFLGFFMGHYCHN